MGITRTVSLAWIAFAVGSSAASAQVVINGQLQCVYPTTPCVGDTLERQRICAANAAKDAAAAEAAHEKCLANLRQKTRESVATPNSVPRVAPPAPHNNPGNTPNMQTGASVPTSISCALTTHAAGPSCYDMKSGTVRIGDAAYQCPYRTEAECLSWGRQIQANVVPKTAPPPNHQAAKTPTTQPPGQGQSCQALWAEHDRLYDIADNNYSFSRDPREFVGKYSDAQARALTTCGPRSASEEAEWTRRIEARRAATPGYYERQNAEWQKAAESWKRYHSQQQTPTVEGNSGSACEALHAQALSRATASLGFDQTLANKFNAECMHRCVQTGMTVRCQ